MNRIFAVLFCCLSAFASDNLDSLLNVQRERAGNRADTLFEYLDSKNTPLNANEIADLRFLLAYLPLSDLASMTGGELATNVSHAEAARAKSSWGAQLSDEMFRNFVLPHRVTQEPYACGWRKRFHDDIAPRVKNLSMTEAALEVNHWCHEKATYQPSDSRDQDPLTTIRAGLGRCEEEMILAICALRSVGIPARQCYTPYWPHMDDNHAWVEVWTDGRWHYLGACEPDVALDRAWFTNAASRAMLVVSTSYGDYQGDEPVLRRAGRTTLINSTAVYGPTHRVNVRLEDHRGRPLPKANVVFSLFNYGAILPAIALETDSAGEVNLTCGLGDWFVSAGKDDWAAFQHITVADTNVTLRLDKPDSMCQLTRVSYAPPPESNVSVEGARDTLFACRLQNEDRLRESLWKTWADEAGVQIDSADWKPDSLQIVKEAESFGIDGAKVYDLMQKARGNWGTLCHFLFGGYPRQQHYTRGDEWDAEARWLLLDQLTEKDARDFGLEQLAVFEWCFTLTHPSLVGKMGVICSGDIAGHGGFSSPPSPGIVPYLATLDSSSRDRFEKYVIAPRIDTEPSRAWRGALFDFLKANRKLIESDGDKRMMRWLRKNIAVDKDRDRLGPPLTPAECLALRRGTVDDIERLYAGLCRVREIPARFDPVSNRLQRWENGDWVNVDLGVREKRRGSSTASGFLTLVAADSDSTTLNARYNREWAVQMWDKDHFTDVDFGFETAFKDQAWPKELPVGLYCLTSGIRGKDGSVPLRLEWFEVRKGQEAKAVIRLN
jgi:transglutaminase-like putative cysteine protease